MFNGGNNVQQSQGTIMMVCEKVMETTCVSFNVVINKEVGTFGGGKAPINVVIAVVIDDTWIGIQNKEGQWISSRKVKDYWMKKREQWWQRWMKSHGKKTSNEKSQKDRTLVWNVLFWEHYP